MTRNVFSADPLTGPEDARRAGLGTPSHREMTGALYPMGVWKPNVPNEAVNLLKTRVESFPKEPKAVNLLKTSILVL